VNEDAELIANRYRLITRIGSGGMGVVWRAKDEVLGRTVAVKVLVSDSFAGGASEESARRAMREARIAARLHHPNVIGVFDVVEHESRPYLVMEYLKSRSLSEMLSDDETLKPREAARIGAQIAAGLAAAHKAGIVHRDVKPGNVLLATDGAVKITDFGISRAAGDTTVTASGVMLGTISYIAPEVAKGQSADSRSDVYSLGATLYAMLEGEPPSGTMENPIAQLYRIVHEDIATPRNAGPLTPVLLWMLEREPDRRPTMSQVQRALEEIERVQEEQEESAAAEAAEAVAEAAALSSGTSIAAVPSAGAPNVMASTAEAADAETGAGSEEPPTDESVAQVGAAALPEPEPAFAPEPAVRPARAPLEARKRTIAIGLAVALALVAGIVVLIQSGGGHADAGNTGAALTGSSPAAPRATQSPSAQTGAGAQPGKSQSPAQGQSPSAPAASSAVSSGASSSAPAQSSTPLTQNDGPQLVTFIENYYALMPNNLAAGWNLMTASYQVNPAGGPSGYANFWGQFSSVALSDVTAQAPATVTATITYHYKSGSTKSERTQFGIVVDGGQWKIGSSSLI
jgi:eukaryotic-like serine/threonine-protein kinase